MENTLTKKELEDYLALFCKITDSFDVEHHLWDESDSLMALKEPVVQVNVWRRLLVITYILMSKKGIVPEVPYHSDEALAYTKDYDPNAKVYKDRLFYREDNSYTRIFENMLRSYGWEQPEDYTWGLYQRRADLEKNARLDCYVREVLTDLYDLTDEELTYNMELSYGDLWEECPPELEEFFSDNGNITLDEVKELPEEQQKRLDTIFKNYVRSVYTDSIVDAYADAYCMMAFHNPKLDIVNNIYGQMTEDSTAAENHSTEYSQMCTDYKRISKLVSYIVDGFYFMPVIVDMKTEGQKYIYTRVFMFKTNDYRYYDWVDPFVLAQPCMIFAIPLLDIQMDEFIQKWGK